MSDVIFDTEITLIFDEELSKSEIEDLEKLEKAKYDKRWRGPDGKWRYRYKREGKGREKTAEEPAAPEKGGAEEQAKGIMSEAGVPDEYMDSTAKLIQEQGYTLDDLGNVTDGPYGYGISVEIGGEEWAVMTRDEAESAAKESLQDIWDEMGADSVAEWVWTDNIDEEKMGRDLSFDSTYYFNEGYDDPDNWLSEDPEGEDGDWTEEQRNKAGEMAENEYTERVESDPVEYINDIYGEGSDESKNFMKDYVDVDGVIDTVLQYDGVGQVLSSYDGNEFEYGDTVQYRLN